MGDFLFKIHSINDLSYKFFTFLSIQYKLNTILVADTKPMTFIGDSCYEHRLYHENGAHYDLVLLNHQKHVVRYDLIELTKKNIKSSDDHEMV